MSNNSILLMKMKINETIFRLNTFVLTKVKFKLGAVYVCDESNNEIRGQTDKKLTSTLVIQTFLIFELADIFLKYGSRLFFKKAKKNSNFHPHRQRRRKQDPLDLSW